MASHRVLLRSRALLGCPLLRPSNPLASLPVRAALVRPARAFATQNGDKPGPQQPPVTDGSDLFSQALAAQRLREQKKAMNTESQQQSSAANAAAADAGAQPKATQRPATFDQQESEQELTDEQLEELRIKRKAFEASEKKRNAKFYNSMSLAVITSAIGTYILLGIDKDPNHPDDTHHQRVLRTLGISTTNKASLTIRPDESKKFLPDPLPEPYGRPYTLFIELNDSLVHPVFDKSVGWKVAIRPGAKDLLAYLSRFYEVVIWTDSLNYVGDPIIQALDPYRFACYRLYRDATTSIGTEYVKDLSVTNRDPKKCIIVDINPSAYQLQPENGMPLQKWNGEKGDDELRKLSAFLDELAFLGMMLQIEDLRPLLKQIRAAGPSNIGDAWSAHKEWMRGEFDKLLPPPPASGISGVTAALFGRSFTPQTTPNVISQIEMLAKQERQAFEKDKVEMEKQLADAMKEQEKQMNEHMEKLKDGNYKFFDYLSGSVPMPGQPQQGN